MTSLVSSPQTDNTHSWLHRWIYYLSVGFMFAAAALRAFLLLKYSSERGQVMLLLAVWLLLFLGNALLTRRLPWLTAVFLFLEALILLYLLLLTEHDFFAFLFSVLSMQAMQRYSPRVVGVLIGFCGLATYFSLVGPKGALQAVALALIYSAVGAFMVSYVWFTRRLGEVRKEQQALVKDLQEANQRLEFHAHRQERLAAGRERQRLARELHDSVTQTIFSMTLTTQTALLLLERDQKQVAGQLDRLDQLSRSALSEMQELISRLAPQALAGGGFIEALQQHLEERRQLDNLQVTLEVEGSLPLNPAEEAGLFRIIQESLNNIVKHTGVLQANVRLHLLEPIWMEVEDHGAGFDYQQGHGTGRMGLSGMAERATGIGWRFQVNSAPGHGTRIRVDKSPEGAKTS